MKCIKCKENNILSVNYCKKCNYQFSKKEREAAKSTTWIGKIEKIEKIYKLSSLKYITGHIIFKILSLIIVIAIGISFTIDNGKELKILEHKDYQIQYNKKSDEYYLLAKKDETSLNLYKPNSVSNLKINHILGDGSIKETINYKENKEIKLEVNETDDYYLLMFKDDKEDKKIKLNVFKVDEEQ